MPERLIPEHEVSFFDGEEWISLGTVGDMAQECVEFYDFKQSHVATLTGGATIRISAKAPRLVTRRNRRTRLVRMNVARCVINRHLRDAGKDVN